jgi:hypothetical protein
MDLPRELRRLFARVQPPQRTECNTVVELRSDPTLAIPGVLKATRYGSIVRRIFHDEIGDSDAQRTMKNARAFVAESNRNRKDIGCRIETSSPVDQLDLGSDVLRL